MKDRWTSSSSPSTGRDTRQFHGRLRDEVISKADTEDGDGDGNRFIQEQLSFDSESVERQVDSGVLPAAWGILRSHASCGGTRCHFPA
jgi:hypothetical protein